MMRHVHVLLMAQWKFVQGATRQPAWRACGGLGHLAERPIRKLPNGKRTERHVRLYMFKRPPQRPPQRVFHAVITDPDMLWFARTRKPTRHGRRRPLHWLGMPGMLSVKRISRHRRGTCTHGAKRHHHTMCRILIGGGKNTQHLAGPGLASKCESPSLFIREIQLCPAQNGCLPVLCGYFSPRYPGTASSWRLAPGLR